MFSLRRILTAVQFGGMRPGMGSCGRLAINSMAAYLGDSSGDARPNDGYFAPPSADQFGKSIFGRSKFLLCLHKTVRRHPKGVQIQNPALETVLALLAWIFTCREKIGYFA